MALKIVVFTACLVAYVRAGDLLPQSLQIAAGPAPIAQIRYASSAPIITKSTIIHPAPAPASIAYHAPAPAATVAYHAPTAPAAALAYHPSLAHAPISYHAPSPSFLSYQSGPQLVRNLAPTFASYAPGAVSYPAPFLRTVAPGPTFLKAPSAPAFVKSIAPAPAFVKTIQPLPAPQLIKTVAPAPTLVKAQQVEEYDPNPQYSFGYDVQDTLTGDIKSQSETRNGDTVQGSYALNEPDGTRRIVDYTADPVNGFNAVVRKEPLLHKAIIEPASVKIAPAPVAFAAPATFAASPAVAFAAPAAPAIGYAAPFAKASGPVTISGQFSPAPTLFAH